MSDSLWPNGLQHARLPCPSPSPRVCKNSCPLSPWSHPNILSPVVPFSSCLQSFPASGSFPMSQLFASGGQSIAIQLQHVWQTGGWIATLPSQLMSPHLPYLWKPDFQEGSGTKVSGVWASPESLRSVAGGAGRSTPTPLPATVTPATPSQTTVGSLTQASWAHSTNSCFSRGSVLFPLKFVQVSFSSSISASVLSADFFSVQFSCLWFFATPWTEHTRPSCPSPTPRACSNSCPLSRWCHPVISSCRPLLLLPSVFPSIRVFSNDSVLHIRWPKY